MLSLITVAVVGSASEPGSAANAAVVHTKHDNKTSIVTAASAFNVVKNEVPDFMMRWIG